MFISIKKQLIDLLLVCYVFVTDDEPSFYLAMVRLKLLNLLLRLFNKAIIQ